MTIVLHWWYLPIFLVIAAFALPMLIKENGDWDMVSGLLQFGIFCLCLAGAAGIVIGHFFA